MSIRQIALELYSLEKKLERLKKDFAEASGDESQAIQHEINETTMERNRIKAMLEAKKKG
ncbi:hypothetical protein [Desulfonatronovibrio magnus]|uniref:hypothetical protein n=1 Tax=Desulfonatronovibrio magnus TaxID=698827 RepID=UPI0005EB008B|nr:hypothetical protein [Desulfonatronovibrio magnus]